MEPAHTVLQMLLLLDIELGASFDQISSRPIGALEVDRETQLKPVMVGAHWNEGTTCRG